MKDTAMPTEGTGWQLLDYQPLPNAYDEAIDSSGKLRGHWKTLVEGLESLGRTELDRRWKQGLAQIQRDGVTFNPYDAESGSSRPWMLDPIPMVFAESEWNTLALGIEQRARLFEALLTDLHGPQRLLQEKIIPAELYFGNPAVYPAYHSLTSPDQRHLSLYATDLARVADGRWIVTGDRTRAPFGLGYVLENRFTASQVFPTLFRRGQIRRVASFFVNLRKSLASQAFRSKENPRIVLLTSGPGSRAYFEDAYLARYMGFILAEGGDLAVRNNQVMLKTLGALLPVEVIFRRADDELCDPVELSGATMNGIAGLLECCRQKNVAVANSLGSRVAESPAFLPWLPQICKFLLAEQLRLPTIQTWWCGEAESLKYVQENLDQLIIRRAFRTDADESPLRAAEMNRHQRQKLIEQLHKHPSRFVGQESLIRSTVPVWTEEGTKPWHLAVRSFSTVRAESITVLPGGLARISPDYTRLDATMTSGERSQDIWVLADSPVKDVRLTPLYGDQVELRRSGPDLPSRAADNMFWLGRYMGRAEGTVRLLREVFQLMSSESDRQETLAHLLRALVDLGQIDPDYVIKELRSQLPSIEEALPAAMFDTQRDRSLRSSVQHAVRIVSAVPDRINPDMSRVVRRLADSCRPPSNQTPSPAQSLAMLDDILAHILAFDGLTSENMTRGFGWLFLDFGIRIERAWQMTLLLDSTVTQAASEEPLVLESLLQIGASLMTYRSRYLSNLQVAPVIDLLVCDETNPRSIAYQLERILEHVNRLPRQDQYGVKSIEQSLALNLLSLVQLVDVFEISRVRSGGRRLELDKLLDRVRELIPRFSELVSSRYLIHAGRPRSFS
jgi:uncharacterized circularly permuted ATP-grasp superfamily protein/uncharacterized alpha-E superfamily protein